MKRIGVLNQYTSIAILIAVCCSLVILSCNKEVENLLKKDYPAETPGKYGKSKVLYIMIDGANGNAVRLISPPVISNLTRNALFSWSGLANASTMQMTGATGWADQLIGVNPAKHGVTSEDFVGNKLDIYPSFITRMEEGNPNLNTAAYSSSASFSDHFTAKADQRATYENDDSKVKDAVITSLKESNPDLLLAQFHSVDLAGSQSDYNPEAPIYKNAILQIDAYVGEIMEALKVRPNYQNENWMVVLTSNRGGSSIVTTTNPYNDSNRNIFTIFYSPKFSTSYLEQPLATAVPYQGAAPRYTYGENGPVATLTDKSLFNFKTGNSGSYTIQFLMKNRYIGWVGYPCVLSKRDQRF